MIYAMSLITLQELRHSTLLLTMAIGKWSDCFYLNR